MKSNLFNNAIVFPYSYEFFPVLAGLLMQGKIDKTVKLVSPIGWGICGLDAGKAFGNPEIGIKILDDFEKAIDGCDLYIISPFEIIKEKRVNDAVNSKINDYSVLAKNKGLAVIDLRIKQYTDYSYLSIISREEINIEVPVVFVSGLTEKVNKLGVLVRLSNSLIEKGYKTCTVGTRHYSDILNMYPFPHFMFDSIIDEEKIEMFRSFIYYIQEKEHPEVIIIGIPGASMPFNEYVPMGYGIINYLISMAVIPDFSIVCTYSNPFSTETINNLYTYRYNQKISCFYISPTKLYYDIVQDKDSIEFEYLDYTMLSKKNDVNNKTPSYYIEETDEIVQYLINILGTNECISVF